MLVLHCPGPGYNEEICEARWLTDEEKLHYNKDCRDSLMICIKTIAVLKYYKDNPIRACDSSFPGCFNRNFIVTQEQADAIIAENAINEAASIARDRAEHIEDLKSIIRRAEKQKTIPTNEEAKEIYLRYNDLENEGEEGYVPRLITKNIYEDARNELKEIQGGNLI